MAHERQNTKKITDIITPLLIIIIFGGCFALVYFKLVQPEYQKYISGGAYHGDTEREHLGKRQLYKSRLERLSTLYQENSRDGSRIANILPSSRDTALLFMNLERLARDTGVGLQTLDVVEGGEDKNKEASASGVKEVTMSLKFTGMDYARLKRLLQAFEANGRFIDIVSLDFDPGSHFVAIIAKTYYRPKKQ